MKCDNVERGCEWGGTVGTLEEHVTTCDFTSVPCPKDCKRNNIIQIIMRKDLEKHLKKECMNREHECQHCGKKDTFTNITGIHDDICEKKVLPCPNADCSESMRRAKLEQHLENDCKHTMISCKYERIGCDVKMKRKDMGAHEQDDKAHLHQALNTVVKLQDDLRSATETIESMKEVVQDRLQSVTETITSRQKKSVVFKIINYEKKKENNEGFDSQSFYSDINEYNMRINVYPNGNSDGEGTHVSVFVSILKGDNDDNLKWPFIGTVEIELLNQLEDENHHLKILTLDQEYNVRVGSAWGYPSLSTLS